MQSFQRGKAAFKKLGVGLGALVAPGKGKKSSTVLTIATPPGRGGPLAEQGRVDECEALESQPPTLPPCPQLLRACHHHGIPKLMWNGCALV